MVVRIVHELWRQTCIFQVKNPSAIPHSPEFLSAAAEKAVCAIWPVLFEELHYILGLKKSCD